MAIFSTRRKTRIRAKGKGTPSARKGRNVLNGNSRSDCEKQASSLLQTLLESQEAVRDILKFYRAF